MNDLMDYPPAELLQRLAWGIRVPGEQVRRMSDGGVEVMAVIKGTKSGRTDEIEFSADEKGSMLVVPNGLEFERLTATESGWATMSTSAVAGLVVRPSTTAAFEIFNGHPVGGKSLVIDRLFYFNLVSTNVIEAFSGWACVTAQKAAPTDGGFTIRGSTGLAYNGPVIAAAGTTIVDSGWFPWTQAYQKGAGGVVPFGAVIADVAGRLIVPPQRSLCLHVVSSLVGQTFTQGAGWFERQITFGSNPIIG